MSSGTYISENVNGSPTKRRAKPLSTASAYSSRSQQAKPKSANGVNGDNLRDTSVNVASAFTQAVQDFTMSQPATNGYTTALQNGRHDLSSRGLGAPPPSRAKKPTSRRLNAPDASEDDIDGARLRGKSPLAEAASSFVRALSPGGSLYLRQRAGVGEDDPTSFQSLTGAFSGIKPNSSQGSTRLGVTQSQTSHGNLSSDYNYSREESMINKMDPPAKPISAAKKRITHRQSGTIAVDKQAYRPPVDEDEEEEWSEDEKGHRRKRAKGGVTQKKLDHLPTMGAQAKHRRRRKGKNGQDDGSESESLHPGDTGVRSLRGSMPPVQDSFDSAGYAGDATASMEQPEEHYADEYGIADSQAHPSQSAFSIGGLLGKIVNMAIRLFASIVTFVISTFSTLVVLIVRLAASFLDVMIIQPTTFVTDRAQKIFGAIDWSSVGKAIIALLVIWMFINSLSGPTQGGSSGWLPPWKQGYPPLPTEDTTPGQSSAAILNLARRLQDMENKLIDMQFSQRRAFDRLDSQARIADESASKLDSLDSTVSKQSKARAEAEEKIRASTSAAVSSLRSEVSSMISQLGHHDNSVSVPDERIIIMERRLQVAEAGVKDAIDASKQAMTVASSKVASQAGDHSATRWWDKVVGSDGKSLTIKSSSGQDVTGLIGSLVDTAVLRWSKDDIAKPDFASYFAGGRIIPQLTTQSYRIERKSSWGNWGFFGTTSTPGRPPITALHPDIHVGNCWPFKGAEGQLGVMLARSVIITEFTIDHAAKEVAFDVRSAPKKMEVWGLVDGAENVKKVADYHKRREQRYRDLVTAASREGRAPPPPEDPYPPTLPPDAHYLRLAQITYDVNAHSHIQTFSVPQEIQDLGVDIGVVVLMVRSNWGEPNWTCLYRFRVHGHDMDRRPYPFSGIDES